MEFVTSQQDPPFDRIIEMVANAESDPLSAFDITTVLKSGVAWLTSISRPPLFYHLLGRGLFNVRTVCPVQLIT